MLIEPQRPNVEPLDIEIELCPVFRVSTFGFKFTYKKTTLI